MSGGVYTDDNLPDLPLSLGVLKHRVPLARGASSCQKNYDGFLLMWCNFKFEDVLFRSDSRHNNRVDSIWECATFGAQVRGLDHNINSTGPHLS